MIFGEGRGVLLSVILISVCCLTKIKKKHKYKSNNQTSKHHTPTHTHIQTKHQTIHLHNFITQLSTKYTSKSANLT